MTAPGGGPAVGDALADRLGARFEAIAGTPVEAAAADGVSIGSSRDGREIRGHRFGRGPVRVSLIGGCHADEPVGPRLLRHLVGYLASLPADDPLLAGVEWWIIPHLNPDGEARNASWQTPGADQYELGSYLAGAVRELPGDDVEFAFPRDASDHDGRPESRAAYDWWAEADGPFHVHATLHGMAFAAGPWYLIEPGWAERADGLMRRCESEVEMLGYTLHDVEREGEKGFVRIRRGFTSRPASDRMREHFLALGDADTAALFRPNSMETIRSFGGDPFTAVSEMPLFLIPGVGETLGPPDPVAVQWAARIDGWRARLADGAAPSAITDESLEAGVEPMPVMDQMRLQWGFVAAGIGLVSPRANAESG